MKPNENNFYNFQYTSSSFNKFLQTSVYLYLDQQHLTRTNYLLSLSLSLALPSACPRESKGGEGVTPRRRARARHATARAASGAFNARSLSSVRVPAVSKGVFEGALHPLHELPRYLARDTLGLVRFTIYRARRKEWILDRVLPRERQIYTEREEKKNGKVRSLRVEAKLRLH